MNNKSLWDGVEVVYSYTREQALTDGVLVDVSEMAKEAGFTFPVACTAGLFGEVITPSPQAEAEGQSINGRLWDALYMLRMAISGALPAKTYAGPGPGQTMMYQCSFTLGNRRKAQLVTLKAICGPGDNGEPVITLLQENED